MKIQDLWIFGNIWNNTSYLTSVYEDFESVIFDWLGIFKVYMFSLWFSTLNWNKMKANEGFDMDVYSFN